MEFTSLEMRTWFETEWSGVGAKGSCWNIAWPFSKQHLTIKTHIAPLQEPRLLEEQMLDRVSMQSRPAKVRKTGSGVELWA